MRSTPGAHSFLIAILLLIMVAPEVHTRPLPAKTDTEPLGQMPKFEDLEGSQPALEAADSKNGSPLFQPMADDSESAKTAPSSPIRWYGFYDPLTGEAVEGETWTFDHGATNPLEGWVRYDRTSGPAGVVPVRRITQADWAANGGADSAPTILGTTGSAWIGVYPDEAECAGYANAIDGGYGNSWVVVLETPFFAVTSLTSETITFQYFVDTEDGFDIVRGFIEDGFGNRTLLTDGVDTAEWSGLLASPAVPSSVVFNITPIHTAGMSIGQFYRLVFEFNSDVTYSDEDDTWGPADFANGAFGLDNLVFSAGLGGATYDFETDFEGFTVNAGIGSVAFIEPVDWNDIPDPLCEFSGNVLEFHDGFLQHPMDQDEWVFSAPLTLPDPPYNLNIFVQYDLFALMPQADQVSFDYGWSYYPYSCGGNGNQWSPTQNSDGSIYFSSSATCNTFRQFATDSPRGNLIPAGAEKVRFQFRVLNQNGADSGNSAPLLDNIRLGVTRKTIRHVPTVSYPNIQAAIDAAAPGDTVLVRRGRHRGVGNRDLDFGTKNIVLLSEEGPELTIIDCEDASRAISLYTGNQTSATIIEGFSFTGGNATTSIEALVAMNGYGGAVYLDSGNTPVFRNCWFSGNSASLQGGAIHDGAGASFIDCGIANNQSTDGGGAYCAGSMLQRCRISLNSATNDGGGLQLLAGTLTQCEISNNTAYYNGGGLWNRGSSAVTDCDIFGNRAEGSGSKGGGIWSGDGNPSSPTYTNCRIVGNEAYSGGGFYKETDTLSFNTHVLTGCVVSGNSSDYEGGGIWAAFDGLGADELVLTSCTVAGNGSILGGGIFLGEDPGDGAQGPVSIAISQSILWGNCGLVGVDGLVRGAQVVANVACSDADPGGYVENLGGLVNFDIDCINLDPLFCSPLSCTPSNPMVGGNYGLHPDSPALASTCGPMGALGACALEMPWITSIADVGNDQGRQVRVSWNGSELDQAGSTTPITEYSLWREVAAAGKSGPAAPESPRKIQGWDFVMTVPASGEDVYLTVAPTLCDSTEAGVCPSTFFVRAHTAEPTVFFDSPSASGYSVDNLAPGAPGAFTVTGVGGTGDVDLAWQQSEAADFQYFNVYRGASPDFVPGAGNMIAQTSDLTYTDPAVAPVGAPAVYYKLSAKDLNGNEGEFALSGVAAVNTPAGTDVMVDFGGGIALTFESVDVMGTTQVIIESTGPELPGFFELGTIPGYFLDITSDAAFTGPVEVCLSYNQDEIVGLETNLWLLHYETPSGEYVDITSTINTLENEICGVTSSLSPFVIAWLVRTDVENEPDSTPREFALRAAYPNPFNPRTTISFDLPAASQVDLRIFDVQGRLIRSLVRQDALPAGRHSVEWLGRDDAGRTLGSGLYFYRLDAGAFSATRRMTLLK